MYAEICVHDDKWRCVQYMLRYVFMMQVEVCSVYAEICFHDEKWRCVQCMLRYVCMMKSGGVFSIC